MKIKAVFVGLTLSIASAMSAYANSARDIFYSNYTSIYNAEVYHSSLLYGYSGAYYFNGRAEAAQYVLERLNSITDLTPATVTDILILIEQHLYYVYMYDMMFNTEDAPRMYFQGYIEVLTKAQDELIAWGMANTKATKTKKSKKK